MSRRAIERIPLDTGDPPCISVVTRIETQAGIRPHEESRTTEFLDALNGLPIDSSIADRAVRLIYAYARGVFGSQYPMR